MASTLPPDEVIARLEQIGVIPVITLDNPELAVPLARALVAGGLPAAEVTFRVDHADEVIARMHDEVPELLVGAGTVLDEATTVKAVEAGAQFIVSPGLAEDSIAWCVEHEVACVPGLCTPSDVVRALNLGVTHVKLFPAAVVGGPAMLRAMAGPFPQVRFMCTGGVKPANLNDFLSQPNCFAVGGTWVVPQDAIAEGDMARIERLCREAVTCLHGFRIAHLGINGHGEGNAWEIAQALSDIFAVPVRDFPGAIFADDMVEVVKDAAPGELGHLAVTCNDVPRAMAFLRSRGYEFTEEGLAQDDDGIVAVYLEKPVAGFGIHLRRA